MDEKTSQLKRKIKTHCPSGHVMKRDGDVWKCTGMVNSLDKEGKIILDKETNKPKKEKCRNRISWNYIAPQQEQMIKNMMGMNKK